MLFRNGTHLIDAVCWFAASEPDWVVGGVDGGHPPKRARDAGGGGRAPAGAPRGGALVHFENGVRAFINMSKRALAPTRLEVFCEQGQLDVRDDWVELWTASPPGSLTLAGRPLPMPPTRLAETPAAIAGVIRAVEHGGDGLHLAREARKTLAIIIAILQSSAAGSAPVRFPVNDL
jgi:predicted dehydrogenase